MPTRQIQVADFGGINQNDQDEVLIRQSFQGSQGGMSQIAPVESPNLRNLDFVQGGLKQRNGSAAYTTISMAASDTALIEVTEWIDPATGSEIEVAVTDKSIYVKTSTTTGATFSQVTDAGGTAYTHASDVAKCSFAEVDGHLFIGLDGADNSTQVYRSGATLDSPLYSTSSFGYVDSDSAVSTAVLYVNDGSLLTAGQRISIDSEGTQQEYAFVSSVVSNAATLSPALVNTHLEQAWTTKNNSDSIDLFSVVYGAGLFVAVGDDSATTYVNKAYITTSADGITWTAGDNPSNFALNSVIYGGGLFVAVGYPTGSAAYIVTSPDGVTWTSRTNPDNTRLNGIAYGNGLFVAVGEKDSSTYTKAYITTSADGITWTARDNPDNIRLNSIVYYNGLFVAVGNFGSTTYTKAYIITSTDGISWSVRDNPDNVPLYSVTYGNGSFVAVGRESSTTYTKAYIITSTDGITWTVRDNPENLSLYSITYSGGLFVAVGTVNATMAYIVTSTDGKVWTAKTNGERSTLYGVAYGAGLFAAVGASTGTGAYITTAALPVFVKSANIYTEAFDTSTTYTITGDWDKAAYLLTEFHARLLFSTANTLVNYTPVATSGIWDGANNGFLQANGSIKSLESFAPDMSDSLKQALYIGTQKGYEVTTGFGASDDLIRIEGAKSPINHRSVVKSSNWLVYLTDDKNIMAINGSNVINLGRRLKNQTNTGVLDTLSTDPSVTRAFGYYNPDKKQVFFHFQTQATYDNDAAAMLDFQLGEPVRGEPQGSYEKRVRCSYWEVDSAHDWISGSYITANSPKGFIESGIIYTLESGEDDFGTLAVNGRWEFPEFAGGIYSNLKQWLRFNAIFEIGTAPVTITVDAYLDQSSTSIFTAQTFPFTATKAIYSASKRIDRRSKYMRFRLSNSVVSESFTIKNVLIYYDIGAEIQN